MGTSDPAAQRNTHALEVWELEKFFVDDKGEHVKAVDGVSFNVEEGSFYTLLGPSGCGKTTTLRCVAGLERSDGGQITVGGQKVSGSGSFVPPHKRDIGMVFQSYAIWPHMTVFENVAFPLRVGRPRARTSEVNQRVEEALATVQLDGYGGRMATQLSGGQQQRLALARALVRRPKLLLLDEPLSNLDAKLREDMRFEVRELQRRLGVTTLYVTHDQVEALSMSSRIAVMESGRIVQEGTPREIYQQPRTAFVANFVGATNFVDAVVITSALSGGVSELQTALGEQPVRAVCPSGTLSGEKVSLAVRPENIHVHVGDQPPADSPNLFRGRVQKALFVGDYLETNILVGSVTLTTRPHPTVRVRTGDTVFVAFPIELCAVLSDTRGVAAAAYGQGDDLTSPIEPSRRP